MPNREGTPGCQKCHRTLACDRCFAARVAATSGWTYLGPVTSRAAQLLARRHGDFIGRFRGPDSIPIGVWAPPWVVACWATVDHPMVAGHYRDKTFLAYMDAVAPRTEVQEALSLLHMFGADRHALQALLVSFGVVP